MREQSHLLCGLSSVCAGPPLSMELLRYAVLREARARGGPRPVSRFLRSPSHRSSHGRVRSRGPESRVSTWTALRSSTCRTALCSWKERRGRVLRCCMGANRWLNRGGPASGFVASGQEFREARGSRVRMMLRPAPSPLGTPLMASQPAGRPGEIATGSDQDQCSGPPA